MKKKSTRTMKKKSRRKGKGWVNDLINKLPVELHAPGGYHFLGPGTKYDERVRGEFGKTRDKQGRLNSQPINELDAVAKRHDEAYNTHSDVKNRTVADREFSRAADKIAKDKSKKFGERALAFGTSSLFKIKNKLGWGTKRIRARRRSRRPLC
jgi:hypothetical protein